MLSHHALPWAARCCRDADAAATATQQPETAIADLMDAGKAAYARGDYLAADAQWRAAIRAQVATLEVFDNDRV